MTRRHDDRTAPGISPQSWTSQLFVWTPITRDDGGGKLPRTSTPSLLNVVRSHERTVPQYRSTSPSHQESTGFYRQRNAVISGRPT